jgi:hypothetical protein
MLKVLEALFEMTGYGIKENQRKTEKTAKLIVEEIMLKLDKNKDNVLQIEEFLDGCLNDELVRQILIDPMFNC